MDNQKNPVNKRRRTYKSKLFAMAECMDCDWKRNGANAIGIAAIHSDKTGHHVQVQADFTMLFKWE